MGYRNNYWSEDELLSLKKTISAHVYQNESTPHHYQTDDGFLKPRAPLKQRRTSSVVERSKSTNQRKRKLFNPESHFLGRSPKINSVSPLYPAGIQIYTSTPKRRDRYSSSDVESDLESEFDYGLIKNANKGKAWTPSVKPMCKFTTPATDKATPKVRRTTGVLSNNSRTLTRTSSVDDELKTPSTTQHSCSEGKECEVSDHSDKINNKNSQNGKILKQNFTYGKVQNASERVTSHYFNKSSKLQVLTGGTAQKNRRNATLISGPFATKSGFTIYCDDQESTEDGKYTRMRKKCDFFNFGVISHFHNL